VKEKVYIAGAYRSKHLIGIIYNIYKARKVGMKLASLGKWVFVPHLAWALFDGIQPDWFWLECGKEMVRYCDTIYMLKKWYYSKGAIEELKLARELNKKVVFEEDFYEFIPEIKWSNAIWT